MQPPSRIPGSASAPFDLTRGDTPAPSAASAAGTQAQQIKRTPVATEHKATFDKAYKACVKELFKYFSDAELAELSRDTAPEKASHRALLCRAMPADKNALDATLDTWIAQSQEAIPDLKDDDPLLFAANGKPHGAAMLAYHRSTVGGAREPLPVRAPLNEKAYENNFAALERFRESFCQSLELDKDARRSDILLEHGAAKRNKWSKPSGPCIWATDEGIDLTQHDEDTLDYLRRTFVNASAGNSQRTRLAEAKPFFEFLAKEYRQRQAEEES